ncbi:hypothetical protein M514_05480 [Trichuris suis]|uniref:Uncharacterized protein n=1 Tax=Trichuris suis TaxID=68888 RepID=A0A085M8L8_9BILA|nr:hypothetical protein M513_05480 [Trichuris suis]KFD69663.1 hypothetical protein M514_05480 [Trichuris suis]
MIAHNVQNLSLRQFRDILVPVIEPAEDAERRVAQLHSRFVGRISKEVLVQLEKLFTDLKVVDGLNNLDAYELNGKTSNAHRRAQWRHTGNVKNDTLTLKHQALLSYIADLEKHIASLQAEDSSTKKQLRDECEQLKSDFAVCDKITKIGKQFVKNFQGKESISGSI